MKTISLLVSLSIFANCAIAQTVLAKTGSKVSQADAQIALDFHNKVRKDVGTVPLKWSAELAQYAQAWADNLANTGCDMKHRPNSGEWKQIHGENIFWGSGKDYRTSSGFIRNHPS